MDLFDKLSEECGVVGVIGTKEASNWAYLSLYALQHRGQEACGIISFDDEGSHHIHRSFGLVADSIDRAVLDRLPGHLSIGHVRYSTQGGRSLSNIQPFFFNSSILGPIAVAHNGNLTNAKSLRSDLEKKGAVFQSTSDTEVIIHLIAHSQQSTFEERLIEALACLKGAFSLVISAKGSLYLARDRFGFRPLVLGKRDGAFIATSEGCALDLIDAEWVREIEPNEVLKISFESNSLGLNTLQKNQNQNIQKNAFCSFEPIYFARPDSRIFGREVYDVRRSIGIELAKQSKTKADVVIAVPDSGVPMAISYAQYSGIEYAVGLVRNHYVGRTFIEPAQSIRDFGVKLKLNPVRSVLEGKKVIVVDDSIVRGTTSAKIIRMLRKAGALEVHLRIGSPPIISPCYFGVDTPTKTELLAAQKSVDEMCRFVGADSLEFLSIQSLGLALGKDSQKSFCFGCFTGVYPEKIS